MSNKPRLRNPLLASAVMSALGLPAGAATIVADTTLCSLADAIVAANRDEATGGCTPGAGADIIQLNLNGSYVLAAVNNDTDGPNGLPSVTSDITINGNGATISRGAGALRGELLPPEFRLLHVSPSGTLSINNATLTGGDVSGQADSSGYGGAIFNHDGARLTLADSTVVGNSALYGAGIHNGGSVTLNNSTVSGNSALADGGGIFNYNGFTYLNDTTVSGNSGRYGGGIMSSYGQRTTLTGSVVSGNAATGGAGGGLHNNQGTAELIDSTVSSNTATGNGGGIYNYGSLEITSSTLSRNNSQGNGGGIFNQRDYGVRITNSTLSANTATGTGGAMFNSSDTNSTLLAVTMVENTATDGGAVYNSDATLTLASTNSIIADNSAPSCGGDDGAISVGGVNFATDTTCDREPDTRFTVLTSAELLILPLLDNGGPTLTHALGTGSRAIDAAADCNALATDQRGLPRPLGLGCDAGAFETGPPEVEVFGQDQSISSGDTSPRLGDGTDFGSSVFGDDIVRTFDIRNGGSSELELTGEPLIEIGGPAAGDFLVTNEPNTPVAVKAGTSFSITFAPTVNGLRAASVTILNNDEDGGDSPFTFAIQGVGVVPTLSVAAVNDSLTEGGTLQYLAQIDTEVGYDVVVSYGVTGDGGANPIEAEDFGGVLPSGEVTITAGNTSAPIDFSSTGDDLAEGDETLTLTIVATGGEVIDGALTAGGTLLDDDEALLSLSLDPMQIAEPSGQATATLSRNTESLQPLLVDLGSSDATTGASVPANVTFAQDAASVQFTVTAVNDSEVDGTKTVQITAAADGFATARASLAVADDDSSGGGEEIFGDHFEQLDQP